MRKLLPFIFFISILISAQSFQGVNATSLTVNVLDDTDDGNCDTNHCSLREAILYAVSGDTINFSVTGTIELDGNQLTIDKPLMITGPGKNLLNISANITSPSKVSRVLYIHSGTSTLDVAISGLTISNGDASTGGGIHNEGENLTITSCKLITNTATIGGGLYNTGILNISYSTIGNNATTGGPGGGIYNDTTGTITLKNSTILGNQAVKGAGGGTLNEGTMTVDNSTFFDNHADSNRYWGGGIGNDEGGKLTITNTTISNNSADSSGAGLRHKGDLLTFSNTIIANNTGAGDCQSDTAIIDGGYNLIEGTGNFACDLVDGVNGNLIGVDPVLAEALGAYGGATQTLPILFSSSPAWDAIPVGVNGCVAGVSTDQRGEARAGGTDTTGYAACDIGAFEFGSGDGFDFYEVYLPLILR
jgi:CSLREA domain-containing protein